MKKLFTLIAVAMMAVGAQAQKISFTADDVASAGTLNEKEFVNGEFKLKITDTATKIAIDANNCYFGTADSQEKFTHRLKTGGKSSSKNTLTLTIPAAGTLKVCVRTGSSSATDRNIVLTQDGTELYNQIAKDADAIKVTGLNEDDPTAETNVFPVISTTVAAGEVVVTYPAGAVNFYAFELVSGDDAAVKTINADVQDGPAYNLGGQKVADQYKGLVIKNGKKMVVK